MRLALIFQKESAIFLSVFPATNQKRHPVTSFYIVDQSLVNRGGHHYDYTTCIAEAAASMGFETVIVANENLDGDTEFANAQLKRSFKNTVYQRDSYLAGLRHLKRAKVGLLNQSTQSTKSARKSSYLRAQLSDLKTGYRQRKLRKRRGRIINQFAKDCEKAFAKVKFDESDHVFLTTVSELELMGLALFLSADPTTISPTWHLQFHFNLFDGRTPEYNSQSAAEKLTRECFESALNRLNYHRLRCYTTSQPLADQYNRLGVYQLASLPYPVAPEFALTADDRSNPQPHFAMSKLQVAVGQASVEQNSVEQNSVELPAGNNNDSTNENFENHASSLPPGENRIDGGSLNQSIQKSPSRGALRFTCPGQIRREKGCLEYLQPLVNELWDSHLATGRVKIAVQRPRRKKFRKEKIELALPKTGDSSDLPTDAIEYFDHPLGREAYIDFIKNTDCGLLFYDSRTYYSRRAGVLGELLSAGKPMIVSAGSWLARQVAEPNFLYGEKLIDQADSVRTLRIEDVEYSDSNVPAAGGVVSFDQAKHPFRLSFNRQSQEQMLRLSFAWKFPIEEGTFANIEITQKDGEGNSIDTDQQIIGHRQNNKNSSCLFRFHRDTETVDLAFRNAFSSSTASLKDIQIELTTMQFVESSSEIPLSSVGIIAADASKLSSAVAEMVLHYDHYKASAEEFAQHWFAMHNPVRTVAHLIANQS